MFINMVYKPIFSGIFSLGDSHQSNSLNTLNQSGDNSFLNTRLDCTNKTNKLEEITSGNTNFKNDLLKVTTENANEKLKNVTSEYNCLIKMYIIFYTFSLNVKFYLFLADKNLNISETMKKVVTIPEFQPKKRKARISEVTVNSLDTVLENLQKKENVSRSFQEKKKQLVKQKKDLSAQIKVLKKEMKGSSDKENVDTLEERLNNLVSQTEEIDRELINVEVESLQSRLKIKQEKL